jgi:hypothetical protein
MFFEDESKVRCFSPRCLFNGIKPYCSLYKLLIVPLFVDGACVIQRGIPARCSCNTKKDCYFCQLEKLKLLRSQNKGVNNDR